jgi:PAS domain S-box-containing protein
LGSVLLGSYLSVLSVVFALFFGYLLHRDKDKRKLMFLLVFVYSAFIWIPEVIPGFENTQILSNIAGWGPLPITSAMLIAVLSGFLNQKDFRKPFKIFLFLLATSIFMIFLPLQVSPQSALLYPVISMAAILVSGYVVLRRRKLPDFMFLLSTICFTLAGVGGVGRSIMGSGTEFVIFAYTCAYIFLALVFVTARETGGSGIASFFVLERELEKTQQELEMSQDQLMRAEYNFRYLVNFIADLVVIVDHKGHFLEINDKVVEVTGFSKEELLGKNFLQIDMLTMKSKAILMKNLAKRMIGIDVKPYEIEATKKSGETVYLEINAQKIEYEGKSADLVVLRDITERKLMEEKLEKYAEQLEEKVKERTKTLKENEEKLRSIFNSSPDAIAVSDLKGNIIECNKAALDFLGLSTKDEIIGKNSLMFVAKKDRQKVMETTKNVLEISSVTNVEYAALNKAGYEFPAEFSASAIKDPSGNPTGFVTIIKDITERKKAEEKIRESEERYRSLVELAPDSIMTFDMKGVVTSCNTASTKFSGYSKDELVGKHFTKIAPIRTRDIPKYLKMLPSTVKGKVPKPFEVCYRRKDGTTAFGEVRFSLMREKDKIVGIQAIMRDITERKKMEDELRHYSEHLEELVEERTRALKESQELLVKSERLAAIGQAATMVGHDLRNPLQAIENATYYLNTELSNLPISQQTTETLQAMHRSIEYADNIVKDLQSFASKREPVFREIDINPLVKETLSQVKTPENVETVIEIGELPKIEADKDMMKRIFVNLALNGIQAMKEKGGTLKVSTKKTNDFIEICFKDTGIGIKKENKPKIFTPFFTTKAQGMGVGLAICKRFAEIHDGRIKVESEEGKGSIFTVKLPIQRNGGVKCD